MANYPIKILIDEQGKEFVPFVNTDVVYFPDGSTLSNALDTKADKTTLAADKQELQNNIDKKADITAMEQTLVDAKAYTDERVTSVYRYQGSVKNYDALPTTNLTVGDVYDTQEAQEGHEAGANYAWNGTTWDKLGMTLDYSKLQSTEAAAAQDAQIALRLKKEDVVADSTTNNIQVKYDGDTKVIIDTKIIDNLTTEDAHASLSANQGKVLAGRVPKAGGQANQVLAKISDADYDMAWVRAADPDSIIGDGSIVKMIEISYDDYLALQDAGQIDPTVEYHIPDYDGDNISTIGETVIRQYDAEAIAEHEASVNHPLVTTTSNGLMSSTDKTKLDSVSLNAVSREDLATELNAIVPEATIDSKIETATKDFISETIIDTKIDTATSDKINSTQAQTLIDNSTKDFVTNAEAQALVSNGVSDKITTTAAQTMVNNAVADKITSTQAQTLIDNKTSNYLPLSGGALSGNVGVNSINTAMGKGFIAHDPDANITCSMGVGASHNLHGLYSDSLNKWMVYGNQQKGSIHLPSNVEIADSGYINVGMKMTTNNNGTAIQFDNGLMICLGTVTGHIESQTAKLGNADLYFVHMDWTYPIPFTKIYQAQVTTTDLDTGIFISEIEGTAGTSSIQIAVGGPANSDAGAYIMAIGLWK